MLQAIKVPDQTHQIIRDYAVSERQLWIGQIISNNLIGLFLNVVVFRSPKKDKFFEAFTQKNYSDDLLFGIDISQENLATQEVYVIAIFIKTHNYIKDLERIKVFQSWAEHQAPALNLRLVLAKPYPTNIFEFSEITKQKKSVNLLTLTQKLFQLVSPGELLPSQNITVRT